MTIIETKGILENTKIDKRKDKIDNRTQKEKDKIIKHENLKELRQKLNLKPNTTKNKHEQLK